MRWLWLIALAGCGDNVTNDCWSWRQWGRSSTHAGDSCAAPQSLDESLAKQTVDPFVAAEQADAGGSLVVHYQVPLAAGDVIYMERKSGTYTSCSIENGVETCPYNQYDTEIWNEDAVQLVGNQLVTLWSFPSDWKPEPWVGFEPMFQPAIAGDLIALPGAHGAIWELDGSGKVVAHIEPFAADATTYVAGPLTYYDGAIYYNALHLDPTYPYISASRAWLVKITQDGRWQLADYADLVPDAPAANGSCYGEFSYENPVPAYPWPPQTNPSTPSTAMPPLVRCGGQLPGINVAPAVLADGTLVTATHAQYSPDYSYVVDVGADLSPRWATSLRGLLHDGCGVLVPEDGVGLDCSMGATVGVDPATNLPPAGQVDDSSSSSPVATPDGGVIYGALTMYNDFRGHLIKLDAHGHFVTSYDFGWDTTPAIAADGSIVLKDNHYGTDAQGHDLGPYYITKLDADLHVQWQFKSSWTSSCTHEPDGTLKCVADHPNGFEWCVNAPAIDALGIVYANSEDGNLYAITKDGFQLSQVFLQQAEDAAYTPVALDPSGHVLSLNAGVLQVLGAD